VVFTPSIYKSYSHPDYAIIKAKTAAAIARSERTTEPAAPNPKPGATPRGTPGGNVTAGADECAYKPVKQ
jgi:hypothetical protein